MMWWMSWGSAFYSVVDELGHCLDSVVKKGGCEVLIVPLIS